MKRTIIAALALAANLFAVEFDYDRFDGEEVLTSRMSFKESKSTLWFKEFGSGDAMLTQGPLCTTWKWVDGKANSVDHWSMNGVGEYVHSGTTKCSFTVADVQKVAAALFNDGNFAEKFGDGKPFHNNKEEFIAEKLDQVDVHEFARAAVSDEATFEIKYLNKRWKIVSTGCQEKPKKIAGVWCVEIGGVWDEAQYFKGYGWTKEVNVSVCVTFKDAQSALDFYNANKGWDANGKFFIKGKIGELQGSARRGMIFISEW